MYLLLSQTKYNMAGIEQASNDLFFKLRNRFPRINLGDEEGNATTNPSDARFFNFDYQEDEIKFGTITTSLIDNENLKVYFSQDITKYMDEQQKKDWYAFLQELRKFAKARMLGLDIRDITKDILSNKDLKFVASQNKEKTQIGESKVFWARRGKVSEGNLNNVKIHVVHNERMMENPNNRLLRVDRIFLVNESGEKFLLPFKNVMGAKAMANHVARGGNPYDTNGRLISTAISEMANLRRFSSATRRKTFESEDAVQVITAAQAIKESIKRSLFRLANNSRFDENLEDLGKLMAEQTEVIDVKPFFTQNTYNENLDNWINSAAKAYKIYKESIMETLKESTSSVAEKVNDPNWKLILKDNPSEDRLIVSSKYADGRALLRRILGTIADRVGAENDDVANWASQIGQDIEDNKASAEDTQIALKLAKHYQEDLKKINSNPKAKDELRVSAFGQKKDLYGKNKNAEEEFESFVNGIGEETMEEEMPMGDKSTTTSIEPEKNEEEYDQEGSMAKDQIHSIVRHAEELEKALSDDENLPEWVQEKMARIKGMMQGVTDYMLTQKERDHEEQTGEEGIHGEEMPKEGMDECGCDDNVAAASGEISPLSRVEMPADALGQILKIAGLR
jgi:hypothetical protein